MKVAVLELQGSNSQNPAQTRERGFTRLISHLTQKTSKKSGSCSICGKAVKQDGKECQQCYIENKTINYTYNPFMELVW